MEQSGRNSGNRRSEKEEGDLTLVPWRTGGTKLISGKGREDGMCCAPGYWEYPGRQTRGVFVNIPSSHSCTSTIKLSKPTSLPPCTKARKQASEMRLDFWLSKTCDCFILPLLPPQTCKAAALCTSHPAKTWNKTKGHAVPAAEPCSTLPVQAAVVHESLESSNPEWLQIRGAGSWA